MHPFRVEPPVEESSSAAAQEAVLRGTTAAGRPVFVLVGAFLLAVLLARLLIVGGAAWWLAGALAVPLSIALGFKMGWLPALAVLGVFALAVTSIAYFLEKSGLGWSPLVLAPIAVFTLAVAWSVLRKLLRGPEPA